MSTWTGRGDRPFDWTDSKNWDGNVPSEDDEAIIPANAPYNQPYAPAGTRVKILRIEGGGLSTRISVRERFDWLGGTIYGGVNLGGAKLIVTGAGEVPPRAWTRDFMQPQAAAVW